MHEVIENTFYDISDYKQQISGWVEQIALSLFLPSEKPQRLAA